MRSVTPPARKAAETLALALVVGVVNWFFPRNIGFLTGFFNPWTVLALFFAVSHGKHYGFLVLACSAVETGLLLPIARGLGAGTGLAELSATWGYLAARAPLPFAVSIVQVYLLGIVRDSLTRRDRMARERLVGISRGAGLLKRQVRALQTANAELEERTTRQEDSITSLYNQVQALSGSNLSKALSALLEMTVRFVGATRCSIWQHRPGEKCLALTAGIGRELSSETVTTLPDEGTIEGWVVRNNTMFSVRMLLANDALARMDTGSTVLAMPISAGRRNWGLLSIEDMPFARYNLYSERLLQVIMALAAPALERAIEFDSLVRQEDIHPVTGLPSFPELYAMMGLELARLNLDNGTLALVVLELANFGEIAARHGREGAQLLLRDLARAVEEASGGLARVFHYKADAQLAALYPKLDADGASLFSLSVLEKANTAEWMVRGERVYIEVILGFSARSSTAKTSDELMAGAESLLEMQKV